MPENYIPTIEEAAGGAVEIIYISPTDALNNEILVKNMIMFSNILSLFQCYNSFVIDLMTISWLKSKQQIHKDENLYTTGQYRWFILKCIFVLTQPYWFLYGVTFQDRWNERTIGLKFQYNDVLTVIQIFIKMTPIYIYIIELTNWTDPKA